MTVVTFDVRLQARAIGEGDTNGLQNLSNSLARHNAMTGPFRWALGPLPNTTLGNSIDPTVE